MSLEVSTDHPDVRCVVVSHHALVRFRQRQPVRAAGTAALAAAITDALARCDITRWPPAWAVSDRTAEWFAVADDVAFPLTATARPGRWLAVTCLRP